ncbi:MAG: putative lipid II flippase FtsW [Parcubacteria group bacterium]
MSKKATIDRPFLIITIILIVSGFFIFSSASLGLLAKESSNYSNVAFSQTVLGLFLGSIAMLVASRMNYKIWRKYAFYILIASVILNILVLFPQFGFEHAGARRWFLLGPLSFQPAEFLKLGFIIYMAAWFASVKDKVKTWRHGFLPFLILIVGAGALLLSQPDTDNFILIVFTGMAMFISAGGKWRYVFMLVLVGAIALSILIFTRPYLMQRVTTFINPAADAQGAGWQIQQSLIAIGSGGLFGSGFGQSIQKFTYLPEPVGDSVFSVAAEEFGFVGSVFLIFLFVIFALRGLKLASLSTDQFGRLLVVGIVIMIVSQAFINIGAMLGMIPLSGITLPFVSHGGTSLFFTLFEVGIVLSVSKTRES